MSDGYTYYEILDLSERATQQQVRTAYLRLVKEHHPDRSSTDQAPASLPC
jgi:curved DNA-binding protein CbpA